METNIFGLVILCLTILISCSAQDINNYRTATWNTNGPKWNTVDTTMRSGLDVFAIQEAGSIRDIQNQLTLNRNTMADYDGFNVASSAVGVQEYTSPNGPYLYYYSAPGPVTKQNMAILTKQRANEIIVIPNETNEVPTNAAMAGQNNRAFINRPALGVAYGDSLFFNLHAEPNRNRNEAPLLLQSIANYAEKYHPTKTWMAMGDFNRLPTQVTLPTVNNNRFVQLLNSGSNTRATGELDYSVVGGPIAKKAQVDRMNARLLNMPVNPSDHWPVEFNR